MGARRRKPGMSIREYLAYRKSKGLHGSVGSIHYWIKRGEIELNSYGRIANPESADWAFRPRTQPDSMTVREYVADRRRRGLPASNRAVSDRERLGYIIRNADCLISREQADFMWNFYRHNVICHDYYREKWVCYRRERDSGKLGQRY